MTVTESHLTLVFSCTVQSMEFYRPKYWNGQLFSPADLPNPGTELRYPALWVNSLPAGLPGKPKNTGVASLLLLQGIFLTQELNHGLLHFRQLSDQLSYQAHSNRTKALNIHLQGPWINFMYSFLSTNLYTHYFNNICS